MLVVIIEQASGFLDERGRQRRMHVGDLRAGLPEERVSKVHRSTRASIGPASVPDRRASLTFKISPSA